MRVARTLCVQRDDHSVESGMSNCWILFSAFYHNDKIVVGPRFGWPPAILLYRAVAMVKIWRRR